MLQLAELRAYHRPLVANALVETSVSLAPTVKALPGCCGSKRKGAFTVNLSWNTVNLSWNKDRRHDLSEMDIGSGNWASGLVCSCGAGCSRAQDGQGQIQLRAGNELRGELPQAGAGSGSRGVCEGIRRVV